MKYFTMEELDYIAKELIDNPSSETLKRLSDKYNEDERTTNNSNWTEVQNNGGQSQDLSINNNILESIDIKQGTNNSIPNLPANDNQSAIKTEEMSSNINTTNYPTLSEELSIKTPVWEPINKTNNMLFNESINFKQEKEANNIGQLGTVNPSFKTPLMPNLTQEAPQINNAPNLEMPKLEINPANNNLVQFNGNLWEPQNAMMSNMMQTTDNFNTTMKQTPNNLTSTEEVPFFQQNPSMVNNPIPVNDPPKVEGPTMFGQFEQDYNKNAA